MISFVVLVLLAVAIQATDVAPRLQLRPANLHVQNATHQRTAQEWQDMLDKQKSWPGGLPVFKKTSASLTPVSERTSEDYQGRIIDGNTAARGQFPWQAHIIQDSSNYCGGSLISSTWILTSARCTSGYASYTVTLGIINRLQPEEGSVSVVSRYWIMHSSFENIFTQHDIAIIRLSTPVSFTEFISAVRLPRYSQASETFVGRDAIVTGFGRLSSFDFSYSSTLQYAQVKIIANEECVRFFPIDLYDVNICSVGEGGQNACDGDGGGPMVVAEDDGTYTVVGIMSFHNINCPAGSPTVFARVTSFLRWLETYAGIAIQE